MAAKLISVFENIISGENVRADLATLRDFIKEERGNSARESLLLRIKESPDVLPGLLKHEDPKIRKNAAALIGDLKLVFYAKVLYAAYKAEEKYFVRTAMAEILADFPPVIPVQELIVQRNSVLSALQKEAKHNDTDLYDNSRHIEAELAALCTMIKRTGLTEHSFTGFTEPSELILITNRNQKETIKDEISSTGANVLDSPAGLLVKTNDIRPLLAIRTVSEFLFVPGADECEDNPLSAVETLVSSDIVKYVSTRHAGIAPYLFRIEAKWPADTKPAYIQSFIKEFSHALSKATEYKFINATSGYDLEIRFVKRKSGKLGILLKFFTLPDRRFVYRKQVNAVSMRPVNAALFVSLAKPYLKDNAAVLDPYCGVGTLLIERALAGNTKVLYGIDISGETLEKAAANMAEAKKIMGASLREKGLSEENIPDTYFIKRDFSGFTHTHRFDEIITEPPALHGKYTQADLDDLYALLFIKANALLRDEGIIAVWSRNRKTLRRLAMQYGYKIEKSFVISEPDENDLVILRKN